MTGNTDQQADELDVILHEIIVRAQQEAKDNQEDANMIPQAKSALREWAARSCQAVGGEELQAEILRKLKIYRGWTSPTDAIADQQHRVDEIMQLISRHYIAKEAVDPFDYVEPCEPECSSERHAWYQGQWEMAIRMQEALNLYTNQSGETGV